jgi:hypothetical protein
MVRKVLPETVAIILIILFLYTGINKLMDYTVFKEQLAVVPAFKSIYPFVAIATPLTEIIIAILLFWPAWRLKGLYVSLALMSLFTIYIVYLLTLDIELPCSCGGIIEFLSWKQHLIFNIAIIVLLILSIYNQRGSIKTQRIISMT